MRKEQFDTPGEILVRVDNSLGDVEVRTHDAPETHVEVLPQSTAGEDLAEQTTIEHSQAGGRQRVSVKVPQRGGIGKFFQRSGGDVLIRVLAPAGASIEIATSSGDVKAEGRFGQARVDTASGEVSVERVDGDLRVRSASGGVVIGSVAGETSIQSASGDVRCDALEGRARVTTASGDLSVNSARSDLTMKTASGNVAIGELSGGCTVRTASGDLHIARAVSGTVQLDSVNGDVTIGVARGVMLAVDAQAVSGTMSSDIDLDADEPANDDREAPRLNLRVRTVSGNVQIQRA